MIATREEFYEPGQDEGNPSLPKGRTERKWPKIRQNSKSSKTSGLVHTTPVEFENGGFTLKTHQMFSVHNGTIAAHVGICV